MDGMIGVEKYIQIFENVVGKLDESGRNILSQLLNLSFKEGMIRGMQRTNDTITECLAKGINQNQGDLT
jgi:hypothetical protein